MPTSSDSRLDQLKARARYVKWRSRIPYTNEQILAALRRMESACSASLDDSAASQTKRQKAREVIEWFDTTRHLTGALYRHVLSYLVETCDICGATALYRYGGSGRCAAHKEDIPTTAYEYRARQNQRSAAIDTRKNAQDQQLRKRDAIRKLLKTRRVVASEPRS